MGGVTFLLFLIVLMILALQVDRMLGLPRLFPPPYNTNVAVPILAAGLLLIAWSIFHFFRVNGRPMSFNPLPKLCTTGPYAHCRYPVLTGIFILLFGLGLLFRSFSLVFLFTPLFIFINFLELKAIEEPELEHRLGRGYLTYRERVPMFIPWLIKSSHE